MHVFQSERSIVYAGCGEDENWHECVSHDLVCDDAFSLTVTVLGAEDGGFNARAAAKTLIDKDWGEAKVRFLVAGGKVSVDLSAFDISVAQNEMNGDWDLALKLHERDLFFGALNPAGIGNVKMEIAGSVLDLTPTTDAGDKLLAFKTACTGATP